MRQRLRRLLGMPPLDPIGAFTAQLDAIKQLAQSERYLADDAWTQKQEEAQELVNHFVLQLRELGPYAPYELLDRCANLCFVVVTIGPRAGEGVIQIRSSVSGRMAFTNRKQHDWIECSVLRDTAALMLRKRAFRQGLIIVPGIMAVPGLMLLAAYFPEVGKALLGLVCMISVLAIAELSHAVMDRRTHALAADSC